MRTLPQPTPRGGGHLRLVHSQKLARMSRGLEVAAIAVAVILVVILCIPLFIQANSFRPALESQLTQTLGRQVKVGNLSVSLFSGGITADNISIADHPAFSKTDFVQARSLKVGVEIIPLVFRKTLNVTELTLNQPEIHPIRSQNGENWNFSSLGNNTQSPNTAPQPNAPDNSSNRAAAKTAPRLSVNKLKVSNGRVTVSQIGSSQPSRVYGTGNVEVDHFSFANSFPFKLWVNLPARGTLKLDGKAGPINLNATATTPLQAKVTIEHMNLAASGFIEPASGISGVADFVGTITSDGHEVNTTGALQIRQLQVAKNGSPARQPVQVQYPATYDLANQTGAITQGDIALGKAIAHLSGTYDAHGIPTSVNLKLSGPGLPVDSLEAMLPAFGVNLPPGSQLKGGKLTLDFSTVGPVDKLVTVGSVRLENSSLAGFNLGSKLSSISALPGKSLQNNTKIQNFSANLRVARDGTHVSDIDLVIPSLGTATGAGTVSPNNTLDFRMVADRIPFLVQGTTSDPKFTPEVKGLANGLLKNARSGEKGQKNPLGNLGG
jgi:AsmA protein